ncbi:hypothetical protein EG19_10905, partial [Thermoanaerobaculum aquaticum]
MEFSSDYLRCANCETLVFAHGFDKDVGRVKDDDADLYGRQYWLSHQVQTWGYPDIFARARKDIPERCLHWLRTLLKYKLPPSRTLELGSGHGGFVALLRFAGYDATGLELSPWVVDFARKTFQIPVLQGPVEDQSLEAGSFDAIILMDVLEHLPNPTGTIRRCLNLLKPDGIFLIQTPRYPEGKSYQEMLEGDDPFLEQLKAREHLFLFSMSSIQLFFRYLGVGFIHFEPAMFPAYDMFVVASRQEPVVCSTRKITKALSSSPPGRLVLALLDLDNQFGSLRRLYEIGEADRAER